MQHRKRYELSFSKEFFALQVYTTVYSEKDPLRGGHLYIDCVSQSDEYTSNAKHLRKFLSARKL